MSMRKITISVLLIVTVLGLCFSAYAAGRSEQITANYGVSVTLNGQEICYTYADGTVAEPFIADGVTYLPIRAVTTALGLNIDYDASTKTTAISTTDYVKSQPSPTEQTNVVSPPQNAASSDVYVYISRTGTKYHSNASCSNMVNPSYVPLSTAIAQGRTPCSKCY